MEYRARKHDRRAVDLQVSMYWEDASGKVHSTRPRARDISEAGMRLATSIDIPLGACVYLDVPGSGNPIEAVVRHSCREGQGFCIGLEFTVAVQQGLAAARPDVDYYEVLQLNANAEAETIHRVFRIMAARFHPDNPQSGDQEKFLSLTEAYRVLGDPARRAEYDARRGTERLRPLPLFQAKAFVDDRVGETNRRLGVLCLLYAQRRRDAEHPSVTLLELEEMMSIPREYLEFTLWYLKRKGYAEITDGADYTLTADGVDFVEEHAPAQTMFVRLLQHPGASACPDALVRTA